MKTNKLIFVMSLVLVFMSTAGNTQKKNTYYGYASWYGKKFHGRTTANGEKYNMYAMTAAHKTLEFGTYVKVTNTENKRSVIVKINDRGPFIKNRIIDLSKVAAVKLDFIEKGTAHVKVEILGKVKPKIVYDNSNTLYRPSANKVQNKRLLLSENEYKGNIDESESPYKKGSDEQINVKSIDIKNFSFRKESKEENQAVEENSLNNKKQREIENDIPKNNGKTKLLLIEIKEKVKKTNLTIFKLQLGAYNNIKSAMNAQKAILKKGIETKIILLNKDKTIFRLLTNKTFTNYEDAKEIQEMLEQKNMRSLLIPL